jgi:large subunit ribosomal protein L24
MEKSIVKTKIKKDDNVVVVSGAERGKRGKVLFVDNKKGRVIVEGVNKRKKGMKKNQENPKGGYLEIEFPITLSNVQIFCEKCKKPTRVGVESNDGKKSRKCNKCGKSIDK